MSESTTGPATTAAAPASAGKSTLFALLALLATVIITRSVLGRSVARLRECAIGAAVSCGALLGLAVQGQRPVLLFATMAVCFVIGFGPLLVWRYSPAGKRERRVFASALEGRRFSLSTRGSGGSPQPRNLRRKRRGGRRQ